MKKYTQGFSVIEILAVIAILAILVAIAIPSLSNFRNQQVLKNTSDDIVSLLHQAYAQTNSSLNGTNYGVHFTSSTATLFTGSTYSSGASGNKVINFDSRVTLASGDIALNGGGSDVIFTRLSGDITNYGTLTIRLTSNNTQTKVINIYQTGNVSAN